MIDAYWYAGARDAHDGQSVYSRRGGGTRIGEQIVRPGVTLFSDPAYPGLECAPFDVVAASSSNDASVFDNGLPLGAHRLDPRRRAGRAAARPAHTAALTGQPVTPAIDNLVLDGRRRRPASIDDLVAGTERGLLLTCLWYIREVDPQTLLLTGLTRDGVYLVENGEITGAVNNFRFNESPVDLLRRFTHASATVPSFSREWGDDYFSRTAMPALRVPDFNMSSVSAGHVADRALGGTLNPPDRALGGTLRPPTGHLGAHPTDRPGASTRRHQRPRRDEHDQAGPPRPAPSTPGVSPRRGPAGRGSASSPSPTTSASTKLTGYAARESHAHRQERPAAVRTTVGSRLEMVLIAVPPVVGTEPALPPPPPRTRALRPPPRADRALGGHAQPADRAVARHSQPPGGAGRRSGPPTRRATGPRGPAYPRRPSNDDQEHDMNRNATALALASLGPHRARRRLARLGASPCARRSPPRPPSAGSSWSARAAGTASTPTPASTRTTSTGTPCR